MNDIAKHPIAGLRDSDATACRIRFPPEVDSQKQGQLEADAGAPREALYFLYAQTRETRRRPKVAAAFCEPNSITLTDEAHLGCGHSPL